MKTFMWFILIIAPIGLLVGLSEIAFGIYMHDAGLQALGLIHLTLNVVFGFVAYAYIFADL